MVQILPQAPSLAELLGSGISQGVSSGMQGRMQLNQALQLEKQKQKLKQEGLQNLLSGLGLSQPTTQVQPGIPQEMQSQEQISSSQNQQTSQLEKIATNPEAMIQIANINKPAAEQIQQMYGNLLKQRKEKQTFDLAKQKLALGETKKFREGIRESAESSQKLLKSVQNQKKILEKGLKTGPLSWDSLMFKIGLKGAASPEAQAYQANLLNYMEGQREKFGVRLSDADLRLIMDKLPDIARSKKGNELVLSLFESEAETELLKKEALKEAQKEGITLDLEDRYERILDRKLKENPDIQNKFENTLNTLYDQASGKTISTSTEYKRKSLEDILQ